jgi:hypothetical protein
MATEPSQPGFTDQSFKPSNKPKGPDMSTYNITLQREGRYWLVYIDGTDGLTQARRYNEAELMAREYISLTQNEDFDTITIGTITIGGVTDTINKANEERARAKELAATASQRMRTAAHALREESVPLTEIGQILGVSHQRAAQLAAA